jgi:hypothetical protein
VAGNRKSSVVNGLESCAIVTSTGGSTEEKVIFSSETALGSADGGTTGAGAGAGTGAMVTDGRLGGGGGGGTGTTGGVSSEVASIGAWDDGSLDGEDSTGNAASVNVSSTIISWVS